jgi:catechol 2,3-dioxygenase-like lactoylglutathione lyase family enzyme
MAGDGDGAVGRGDGASGKLDVITAVHHFALTVAEAERSTAFYRGLGFGVVADRALRGGYVEQLTGVPGADVRIVLLSGPGGNLELIEYRHPRGRPRSGGSADVGTAHLCLLTDDLEAEIERLRAAGIAFRSAGPVTLTSGPNHGARGIYAEDPDGNAVELVEPPAS